MRSTALPSTALASTMTSSQTVCDDSDHVDHAGDHVDHASDHVSGHGYHDTLREVNGDLGLDSADLAILFVCVRVCVLLHISTPTTCVVR